MICCQVEFHINLRYPLTFYPVSVSLVSVLLVTRQSLRLGDETTSRFFVSAKKVKSLQKSLPAMEDESSEMDFETVNVKGEPGASEREESAREEEEDSEDEVAKEARRQAALEDLEVINIQVGED